MARSGISYSSHLEWVLASRWAGYKFFEEFLELEGSEQSYLVAAYQSSNQIDAVLAQEQARKSRIQAAVSKSKGIGTSSRPGRRRSRRR